MATLSEQTAKGGAWLIEESDPSTVMSPEQLSDEHRMIGQTAAEFVDNEVLPNVERLEQKDWTLNRELLAKCGSLGLLGTNVPEEYGGVDLDKIATLVVSEQVSRNASFGATFGAQANLTILPIYMFGTDEQKQKYLPGLVSGQQVGAYCLSESGSGSDSLGAKARAMRQADGSFLLSGEKMWITNGGFADIYVVFAKVDGEQFTAFIVELAWPGVSSGKEEHKMGLHGSSTTPVILQDVKVPGDNVLGEIGKGHKVAFNVLNFGRFKLGAMCSGGARGHRRGDEVRHHTKAVRRAHRHLRRDQAQARRDDGSPVRARKHDVPHRRVDRRERESVRSSRRPAHAAGTRGVRRRGIDRQGARQRSPGFRAR